MNTTEKPFYCELLKKKLAERTARNQSYSLRAFARSLNLEPGALSQIIEGKRHISDELTSRLTEGLALSPEEQEHFHTSVAK